MSEPVATFSIVACDLEAGQGGVAVESKFLAAGSLVPWAEPHVGAVATQAYANPRYGPDGLAALRDGAAAEEVVARLTLSDDGRAERQVGVVAARGRGAGRRVGRAGAGVPLPRQPPPRLGRRPHGRLLRRAGEPPRLRCDRGRA